MKDQSIARPRTPGLCVYTIHYAYPYILTTMSEDRQVLST